MFINNISLPIFFIFLLFLGVPLTLQAEQEQLQNPNSIENLEARLATLEKNLQAEPKHIEASIPAYLLETSALERETSQCEETQLQKISKLEESLAILEGKNKKAKTEDDDNNTRNDEPETQQKTLLTPELKAEKDELKKAKKKIHKELAHCRVLLVRAKKLSEQLEILRETHVKQYLFHREQNLNQQLHAIRDKPSILYQDSLAISILLKEYLYWDTELSQLIFTLILACMLGIALRFRYHNFTSNKHDCIHCASPLLYATERYLIIFSPWWLMSIAGWLFLDFNESGEKYSFVKHLFEQITLAIMILIFLRGLARVEQSKDWTSNIGEHLFQNLTFWARWVILLGSIGLLFYHTFSDIGNQNTLFALLRHALILLLCLFLARLLWILVRIQPLLSRLHIHLLGLLLLMIALGAHLMGYRNLSVFLLYGFVGTLMTLTSFAFFYQIINELVDSLHEGRTQWQKCLRQKLHLKQNDPFPGLLWIRLSSIFILFLITTVLLLYIWDLSDQSLDIAIEHIFDEFSIGGLNLELNKLLLGILILVVLLNLSRLLQVQLRDRWLKNTTISQSAREASAILFGYFGVILSILIGLSVGGINLSSLAFIAGALSIGIGFGLQNVVNNFVSGLILLFERPIRRGDWIKIKDTEGYVKSIKIRSTIIQTFDRSDIIVPNSQLISNEITNYFLDDRYGRIIVPVGVAYGSDPHQVIKLLEDCARRHDKITKDHPNFYLRAFFMGFGDSTLNFELRCFTHNIDSKLSIKSDLGLLIYDALNDAGISIPFPQRDVHLHQATTIRHPSQT